MESKAPVCVLLRQVWGEILAAPISWQRKAEVIVLTFGVRKFATHFVTLGFFCLLVPLATVHQEARAP